MIKKQLIMGIWVKVQYTHYAWINLFKAAFQLIKVDGNWIYISPLNMPFKQGSENQIWKPVKFCVGKSANAKWMKKERLLYSESELVK